MTSIDPVVSEHDRLRCDLVMEQTLGHVTHTQNLQRLIPSGELITRFVPIAFDPSDRWARLPGHQNWTLRAGVRAKAALRKSRRASSDRPDVMFVHTQVPAVLLRREMRAVPTVVSLDATPKQYDELGTHYAHTVGHRWVESIKADLNRRCFQRAAHLVTWARWTKTSLVADYGVDPERVTVIPPGVDVAKWSFPPGDSRVDGDVIRLLFVGGNLERKGGNDLISAFGRLRSAHGEQVELHVVTTTPVDPAPGVLVYNSMKPNSSELIALYQLCDVFCLPTLGDCLPMVLPEAAAAGLALVSTDVGAIREIVRDGETGLLVDVGSVDGLTVALDRLIIDAGLRSRLASNANALVRAEHDAATNASRLVDVLREVALDSRSRGRANAGR